MMTAKEYIKKIIQKLVNDFKNIEVSYQYDDLSDTHIIKVIPDKIYHHNNKYKNIEFDIYNDFSKKYPDESIVFITSDSLIDIENPEFILKNHDLDKIIVNNDNWKSSNFDIHLSSEFINLILQHNELTNESLLIENFESIENDRDILTNNIFIDNIQHSIFPQSNETIDILTDDISNMAFAA